MLQAKNINKQFDNGKGIFNCSLEVKPGQLTAIIGPSGGGKTTLLKSLAFLNDLDSGVISLDEVNYKFPLKPNEKIFPTPWPKVTVVFQQLFLWPHKTLRENIMLPVENMPNADKELEELIKLFDMESFIDHYPNEVSGGERQRAALARALIIKPEFILLDEITSALDIEQTVRVLDCLNILKQKGIGILLVTHHINFAKKSADSIYFVDKGKILEHGSSKIIKHPQTERFKQFLETIEKI